MVWLFKRVTACRGDDELEVVLKSDCELDLSVLKRKGKKEQGKCKEREISRTIY